MSRAELEAFLLGLLRLWQVEARVSVPRVGETVTAHIERGGLARLTVTWQQAPFGIVWQVEEPNARIRTYPSVIGLIRHLRHALAPMRDAGRVLFAGRVGEGQ